MLDFITTARALTDENRARILMALRDREMCVCQVTAFLDLSPSTTSKHLSILKQARLIESRKKGTWVYYRLADGSAPARVREALAWAVASVGESAVVREDARRITDILERERRLCSDLGADADTFHSLEIHTLSEPEKDAAEGR
ncbi:MAG: metalloregulator ArsR/SmtB family transcription factor [Deltaproteobacteria bacterium]|jgi:ArsR family transcriptional regulator|nr:metalloregulator ArsR/SmtB family transcription factor [Deltaproteobacteria bacterium]